MKVAELEGALLDYWVAKAEGMLRLVPGSIEQRLGGYSPSTQWKFGGPIIARMIESGEFCAWEERGIVTVSNYDPEGIPCKRPADWELPEARCEGPTLLVSAMRAYVTSKLGLEVPDTPPA